MAWNDNVASQSTFPPLEQLDPWKPRWERAFEIKMASKAQQHRDRNEDSDSMYSDDLEFVTLVAGTEQEQEAAREACNDGDDDSVVSDSDAESCFDDDQRPKEAEPKAGIARQWKTGFVLGGGGELQVPTVTDHDDLTLHVDSEPKPQVQPVVETPAPLHASPGGTAVPLGHNGQQTRQQGGTAVPPAMQNPTLTPLHALLGGTVVPLFHNGPQARHLGGTFVPPPLPIMWEQAPKDTRVEDMPGFLDFTIRDGQFSPEFDERTWTKGFSRCLRKHIIQRVKREHS